MATSLQRRPAVAICELALLESRLAEARGAAAIARLHRLSAEIRERARPFGPTRRGTQR